MTDLATIPAGELSTIPTPALLGLLRDNLSFGAKCILNAAKLWCELERRGVDLSPLRTGVIKPFVEHFAGIVRGAVLPEVVLKYLGDKPMLKRVAAMSLEDQRAIADGTKEPPSITPRPFHHRADDRHERIVEPASVIAPLTRGAPRDVAEAIADAIRGNCTEPGMVALHLIELLTPLTMPPAARRRAV
jgi:hypothetical protein